MLLATLYPFPSGFDTKHTRLQGLMMPLGVKSGRDLHVKVCLTPQPLPHHLAINLIVLCGLQALPLTTPTNLAVWSDGVGTRGPKEFTRDSCFFNPTSRLSQTDLRVSCVQVCHHVAPEHKESASREACVFNSSPSVGYVPLKLFFFDVHFNSVQYSSVGYRYLCHPAPSSTVSLARGQHHFHAQSGATSCFCITSNHEYDI